VQDFNSKVQAAINRIQTYDETLSIINEARKRNFKSINIDLIYGLPKQTIKSFTETIKKVINISPDRIAIYNFAYLPNLFKTQRQIKKEDLPTPEIKLKMFNETIRLLTSAGYIYIGMDHFAKKNDALTIAQDQGKLHRNFQGYSTNSDCDVIGFGITGISKINNTYSQNLKSLEEYHAIISDKQTPVLHGYQLTFDDEIRREVISQLMCHFKIEFDDIEYMYEINFNDYFSNELNILTSYENDRLLTINYNSIKISPKGRLLIRNICTVFDAYFGKNIISYSKMI
jgi:oxygen-independent coproporphyrinogen-3 oxidase